MGERQRGSRHPLWWSFTRPGKYLAVVAGAAALLGAFALGRLTAPPQPYPIYTWSPPAVSLVQFSDRSQGNDDPRELIPLPGQGPFEQPQSGPGEQPGECPLYFYQDGQLFQMRPGGPGQDGPLGGGNPELFPLDPVPPGFSTPPAPQPPPAPPEPDPPFFRAPGVASAPSTSPLLIADRPDVPASIVSRLPGR